MLTDGCVALVGFLNTIFVDESVQFIKMVMTSLRIFWGLFDKTVILVIGFLSFLVNLWLNLICAALFLLYL